VEPDSATPSPPDIAQWKVRGLKPGTAYDYQVLEHSPGDAAGPLLRFEGRVVTQRPPGEEFTFVVLADTHIPPPYPAVEARAEIERVFAAVMQQVAAGPSPDFLLNLGDLLGFHHRGFNAPPASPGESRDAYRNYRALAGPLLGSAAHFPV